MDISLCVSSLYYCMRGRPPRVLCRLLYRKVCTHPTTTTALCRHRSDDSHEGALPLLSVIEHLDPPRFVALFGKGIENLSSFGHWVRPAVLLRRRRTIAPHMNGKCVLFSSSLRSRAGWCVVTARSDSRSGRGTGGAKD